MRRCISCRQSKPQNELMRLTLQGSELMVDTDHRRDGRGLYLCKDRECIDNAIKRKAFNRVCKRNVDADEIRSVIEPVFNNN